MNGGLFSPEAFLCVHPYMCPSLVSDLETSFWVILSAQNEALSVLVAIAAITFLATQIILFRLCNYWGGRVLLQSV